jgi:large subunit ribosomal protein L13
MPTRILTKSVLNSTKTSRPTTKALDRDWYVIDLSKEPLGRAASKIATALMGKNNPQFSQDIDMGGVVVVINAEKVVLTGKKREWKTYFRHDGRPGRLKSISFERQLDKDPTRPVYLAVKNMIPKNSFAANRMNQRLKIFVGETSPFNRKMKPLN